MKKPSPLLGVFFIVAGLVLIYAFGLVHLEGEQATVQEVWGRLSWAHRLGVIAGFAASAWGLGVLIDALTRLAKRRTPPGLGGME